MEIWTPEIKLDLVEKVSKKHTDPVELNLLGIIMILSYPEYFVMVYTAGSADKGIKNAGYGARIEYADRTCDEIRQTSSKPSETLPLQSAPASKILELPT